MVRSDSLAWVAHSANFRRSREGIRRLVRSDGLAWVAHSTNFRRGREGIRRLVYLMALRGSRIRQIFAEAAKRSDGWSVLIDLRGSVAHTTNFCRGREGIRRLVRSDGLAWVAHTTNFCRGREGIRRLVRFDSLAWVGRAYDELLPRPRRDQTVGPFR